MPLGCIASQLVNMGVGISSSSSVLFKPKKTTIHILYKSIIISNVTLLLQWTDDGL